MLVYQDKSLEPIGYTDSDFQSDIDSRKSTSGYVFMMRTPSVPVHADRAEDIAISSSDTK